MSWRCHGGKWGWLRISSKVVVESSGLVGLVNHANEVDENSTRAVLMPECWIKVVDGQWLSP